ncbi:prephenate dehydrogenase [Micrococcales bacterium 31B]|nr:prephenate dehydrogenase [Micrococcales bacterium 31B]
MNPRVNPALPQTIRVVGTGLMGTSVALAAAARGVHVNIDDASPGTLRLACDLGAGVPTHRGKGHPQLIVVAAPPDVTAHVVAAELEAYPEAFVTDVASVKGIIEAKLEALGADVSRYIGGHPMAGREKSGPLAGRADLFFGRPWVLTPSAATRPAAVTLLTALAQELGAFTVVMDPDEHDRAVALVSHAPQLVASLMASRLADADPQAVALAGQGVRDVTRIAASDPNLWQEILASNAASIHAVLKPLRDDLDEVLSALSGAPTEQQGARARLARAIDDGRLGQSTIPGKHGAARKPYAVLTVAIEDEPNQLARLFADIASHNISVEEFTLDHSHGREIGLAEISVKVRHGDELTQLLTEAGWKILE